MKRVNEPSETREGGAPAKPGWRGRDHRTLITTQHQAKPPAFPPRIFQGEIERDCLFLVHPGTMVCQQGGWHTVGKHLHI